MSEIKTWHQRCMEHPDHQTGMVSDGMIRARMCEEIEELRARLRASETKIERLRAEIDGLEAELSLMKAGFEVAYRALGDKP
jgi:predicted RNase H-like nuclease (RuvC/YqgF family)